jgi:hypothetical protein
MSLLGANVYANPTTPLWGGAGSNLPTDPTFNTVTFTPSGSPPYSSTTIGTFSTTGVQDSTICILNGSNQLGPLCATALIAGVEQDYPRVIYQADGIDYQAADSTSYFLATVNSGSNGWDLSNISTINGSPPGGGSYPRDASFNSIVIDPSGIASPLTIGTGSGGTVMGIRRIEVGSETDYITFAPNATEMALTNVVSLNGGPVPFTLTAFNQSNLGSFAIDNTTTTPLLGTSVTAPADGKLLVQSVANLVCKASSNTNAVFLLSINGTDDINSTMGISADTLNAETIVTTMAQYPVTGGTLYDCSAVAQSLVGPTDWVANNTQIFLSFTTA